ncbi:MAG TPA: tetratricopeptide repeat protein [Gaiellaceae bacterium]|nr:tetratricopeptide repeat protein [Gaiellaceae bacterium]
MTSYEDEMFFPKLRRQAKWMFVFLALVFGLGFVVFGIGSDQGTGIGDLFRDQGGGGSGIPSVNEAQERVEENPRDAVAKRDLAAALESEGRTNEAIVVLGEYTNLRPKDETALRQLASLYLTRAQEAQRRAQNAQALAQYRSPGPTFAESLKLGDEGETLGEDPINEAVTAEANETLTAAYSQAQQAYGQAVQVYERLVAVAPRDPNTRLELAQAAQQSGDVTRAVAAYEEFVKLAPDDPTTPLVKDQIKQLKESQGGGAG